MADTILEDVTYKTSYIKSGIAFVFFGFTSFAFSMFFIDHEGLEAFVGAIVVFGGLLYLRLTVITLFFKFYLTLDRNGMDLCGKKLSWEEIHDIKLNSLPTNFIHDYTIIITYGEQDRKPLLYYYNKRKDFHLLQIYSFQLNASAWDIYETLKAFHEAYGKDTKSSIRLQSNTAE